MLSLWYLCHLLPILASPLLSSPLPNSTQAYSSSNAYDVYALFSLLLHPFRNNPSCASRNRGGWDPSHFFSFLFFFLPLLRLANLQVPGRFVSCSMRKSERVKFVKFGFNLICRDGKSYVNVYREIYNSMIDHCGWFKLSPLLLVLFLLSVGTNRCKLFVN